MGIYPPITPEHHRSIVREYRIRRIKEYLEYRRKRAEGHALLQLQARQR